MAVGYERGLAEVGEGILAYLQPDGGWGWSNAGLVSDGEATLLIDTLFDLHLTEAMLAEMRRAVPAAERIGTLVNTHANGDHCYGNQLLAGAGGTRIIASEASAADGHAGRVLPALLRRVRLQRHRAGGPRREVQRRALAAGR